MVRKKTGRDLSSVTPGPSPCDTPPPVLRLNHKPPHPSPLTPTSSSSHNTWGPRDPLLPQPPTPTRRPATTPAIRKATGPLAGKGANVRAALQGLPVLPTRPRWGHPRPVPAAPAPGIVAGIGPGAVPEEAAASPGSQVPGAPGLPVCPHSGAGLRSPQDSVPSLRSQRPAPCSRPAFEGKSDPPSRLWFLQKS